MAYNDQYGEREMSKMERTIYLLKRFGWILGIIILLLVGLTYWVCLERIDQGSVAVVTRWGESSYIAKPGLNLRIPIMEQFHIFTTREQVYEVSKEPKNSKSDFTDVIVTGQTSDGQPIDIAYSITFRTSSSQVFDLYKNTGENMDRVVERVVKLYSRSMVRLAMQNYTAATLYSNKLESIQISIEGDLKKKFEMHFVELVSFQLRKIDFDTKYVNSIVDKEVERQNVETAKQKALSAKEKADEDFNKAEGDRRSLEARAKGEAAAIREKGKALRENPEIVQFELVQNLKNVQVVYLPSNQIMQIMPEMKR